MKIEDTYSEMDTDDKVKVALRLLRSINSQRTYTVAFSGGKDSVVLSYLCRNAGLRLPHVYNVTTIDPPHTISFCRAHGCELRRPKQTFLQLVERKGMPTQFRRFCCKYLKEQYVAPYLLTGVRRAESVKRTNNYCSFEDTYKYSKKLVAARFHPLLYFTNEDIEYIVNVHQLQCHPLYYDADGRFCVERRLGCIGCPLQGNRGVSDYLQYPRLLKAVIVRLIKYHVRLGRTPHDAYLNCVYNLFYSNHGFKKFQQTYYGFFERDPKAFLESYFNISLP